MGYVYAGIFLTILTILSVLAIQYLGRPAFFIIFIILLLYFYTVNKIYRRIANINLVLEQNRQDNLDAYINKIDSQEMCDEDVKKFTSKFTDILKQLSSKEIINNNEFKEYCDNSLPILLADLDLYNAFYGKYSNSSFKQKRVRNKKEEILIQLKYLSEKFSEYAV